MYSDDLITITDIRERSSDVSAKIAGKSYPCPVLANNKIQFYIMSEQEYTYYQKIKKIMEIDSEVQEAKAGEPIFKTSEDLITDLVQ